MKQSFERSRETIRLDNYGINHISEELESSLQAIHQEKQNILRIRLSIEEALLRFQDRFGDEASVVFTTDYHLRRPYIEISLAGELFNPLSEADNDLLDWSGSLLTSIGLSPQYNYLYGKNILRLSLPIQGMNRALTVFLSILIGLAAGLLIAMTAPEMLQNKLLVMCLNPLYDVWISILTALSGPVIALMVLTTIVNTGTLADRGGSLRTVVMRYFRFSLLIALIALICSLLLFPVSHLNTEVDDAEAFAVLQFLYDLIPNNIFSPVIEANTLQLLVMAVIIGNALIVIGSRASDLVNVIKQANMVGLLLSDWLSRLVPFFTVMLIVKEILEEHTTLLLKLWMALLLSLALSLVVIAGMAVYTSRSKAIPLPLLLRKLRAPFRNMLRTGSMDNSYGLTEETCIVKLGINRSFVKVSLPLGTVLYLPINVIGTLVFTISAASVFHVELSFAWLLAALVLAVVLFVATPPVPGANLLGYVVLFLQLGIPEAALVDAMVFDLIFGVFASAGNQTLLAMELLLQADKIGLVNKDILSDQT